MPSASEDISESVSQIDFAQNHIFTTLSDTAFPLDNPLPVEAFALIDTANVVDSALVALGIALSDNASLAGTVAEAYSFELADFSSAVDALTGFFKADIEEQTSVSAPQIVALAQLLAESTQAVDQFVTAVSVALTDQLDLSAADIVAKSIKTNESVAVLGQLVNDLQLFAEVTEQADLLAQFGQSLTLISAVQESIPFTDTLTTVEALALIDRLLATGQAQTAYSAAVTVLSAILAGDNAVPATSLTTLDTLQVSDSDSFGTVVRVALTLEAMSVTDTYQNSLTVVVQDTNQITISDNQALTKQLFSNLLDEVDVYTLFKSPSEIAQGVAMNLEGSKPISEYDNFTYNSLTSFGGKFYGANDAGLFRLDADDDDGTAISARLQSLMVDFGTSRQKRVRSAYLGYTSSGELVLRVKSVSQGVLTEDWYTAKKKDAADAPQGNIMHIGQGLKSRYWQFELTNVDGADFEVDLLEMHPIFLGRRV